MSMMMLTINGKKVKAKEGSTLLEVCRKNSISIPTLCYHPDLIPHGSCRLCTVEISENGKARMVTACNFPVREGIKVETHSKKVLQVRRILIQLLLARCPQVPFLQNFAREWGVKKTPFKTENPEANCILCGLCVRTCDELVGAQAIGFSRRGTQKKIGTPFEIDSDRCIACGACESICPTGAIQMEMDRIRKLKWSDTGTRRYCRYMRLGLVDFMICSNGFECWRCEVDQMIEDRFKSHPVFVLKPGQNKQPFSIDGFTFYPDLSYSEGHIWAKPVDQHIRLGLDEMISIFAMEADSITLPPLGSTLKEGQVLAEITAAGKKVKLVSPLTGTVAVINHDVEESPNLVWRDPYRRGWLLMIQPERFEDLFKLYTGEKAKAWFTQQATNLNAMLMKRNPSPSKGKGPWEGPLIRRVVHDQWGKLVKTLSTPGSQ